MKMEIKIIAIDPHDGWYFFEKEGKIFLFHPPYVDSSQVLVSKHEMEKAIQQYNFKECDISFKNINDTIRFVEEEYIKIKKAQGINTPSDEQLKELLNYATDEILWEYLRKAEHILIPDGKYKIAKSIARDFLKLEKVKNNPAMNRTAWKIIKKCEKSEDKQFLENSFVGIKVIGIGGGGNNVIKEMIKENIKGIELIALNTDSNALSSFLANQRIQIGRLISRVLGINIRGVININNIVKEMAKEDKDKIIKALEKTNIVFIITCMGGEAGTDISPIIAEIAKKGGALTIGIVTKPFLFEGMKRNIQADKGIKELKDKADVLVTISNDNLLKTINKDTSLGDAFELINKILCQSVKAITDLFTTQSLINLEISDIRKVLEDAGLASVGIGTGKGREKAYTAAKMAISDPLLELSIKVAKSLLVNITGGIYMSLLEVNEIMNTISKAAGKDTNIVFGAIIDKNMLDEIRVSLMVISEKMKRKEVNKNYFGKKYKDLKLYNYLNTKIELLIK